MHSCLPACPDTSGTGHREERDDSLDSLSEGMAFSLKLNYLAGNAALMRHQLVSHRGRCYNLALSSPFKSYENRIRTAAFVLSICGVRLFGRYVFVPTLIANEGGRDPESIREALPTHRSEDSDSEDIQSKGVGGFSERNDTLERATIFMKDSKGVCLGWEV